MPAIAVTGASRGIGAAIARELARRGRTVACLTRSGEGVEGLPAFRCDMTDAASIRAAVDHCAQDLGGLAGLVNNAGILVQGPSESYPLDDFRRVLETNTVGPFVAAQAAFPHLVANGGGIIVNIGSFWERLGARDSAAYCASKAGVAALTRALAVEWAARKIWLYNVAPGFVATDMNAAGREDERFKAWVRRRIPVGRPGTPEEVARLVAALFGEDLPFLTGETIVMDGGQSISN